MTLATIGILLLLFSTSVQGAKTTIRPIEDWAGEEIVGWADDVSMLAIHPHAVEWSEPDPYSPNWPLTLIDWEHKSIWEYEFQGFIQERVIDEETTLITIHVHVEEVPFMIFNFQPGPAYIYFPPLYHGIMQYSFQCRILFNTESLYTILDASGEIPSFFQIMIAANPVFGPIYWPYPEEPAPLITFTHFVGEGSLTDGEGTVYVNQVGIWDAEIGDFKWPHDSVVIK